MMSWVHLKRYVAMPDPSRIPDKMDLVAVGFLEARYSNDTWWSIYCNDVFWCPMKASDPLSALVRLGKQFPFIDHNAKWSVRRMEPSDD